MAQIGKRIPHLEDLNHKPEQVLSFIKLINEHKVNFTEKFDGLFVTIIYENEQLIFQTKSKTFRSKEDFPSEILAFKGLKEIYEKLELIKFTNKFYISGEAIPYNDFNTIQYDADKIGGGVFVILYPTMINEQLLEELNTSSLKFIQAPEIDSSNFIIEKIQTNKLESLYFENKELLTKAARREEQKAKKELVKAEIKDQLFEIKMQMLKSVGARYKPILGKEIEGIVVSSEGESLFKLVDKEKFTKNNINNWELISAYNKTAKDFIDSRQTMSVEDAVVSFAKKIEMLNIRFEQIKKEELLNDSFIAQTNTAKHICEQIYKEVNDIAKVELGHALKTANSIVPKSSIARVVSNVLSELELEPYKTVLVGNNQNHFVGDIDVAISKDYLLSTLGATEDTFWEELDKKLKTVGREYKINKGLKQFHILCPLVNQEGEPIQGWIPNVLERTDSQGFVQVDFLIGDLSWMSKILSVDPKGKSSYKAAVRNLFLRAMCEAHNITNKRGSMEYSLNFRDGLWLKIFDFIKPTGRQRNIQKVLIHKSLISNVFYSSLNNLLFNDRATMKEFHNTFEFWFERFTNDFDPSKSRKALELFKTLCEKNHMSMPAKAMSMFEGKKVVALYPGSFKPFHRGHYEIVKQLCKEADEVKILVSLSDREDFTSLRAYNLFERSVRCILPSNATIEYTKNPFLYAHKLAHENKNIGNKTLLFVDKRESKFSNDELFELRTSDRLFDLSGTTFRKAIREKDFDTIKKHIAHTEDFGNQISDLKVTELLKSDEQISHSIKEEHSLLVEKLNSTSKNEKNTTRKS